MYLQAAQAKDDKQWLHTREIAYMIYCSATSNEGRESIFEFMPLPGDPTKEELQAAKKKQYKKKADKHAALVNSLKEKGLIKKVVSNK